MQEEENDLLSPGKKSYSTGRCSQTVRRDEKLHVYSMQNTIFVSVNNSQNIFHFNWCHLYAYFFY